jgi:hypothetical protein
MVVDLNFMADNGKGMTTFYVSGVNSVFLDASFDMDMGGAKMSQIIGKRLGYDLNPNSPSVDGKKSKAVDQNNVAQGQKRGLFTDMQDMVLKAIRPKNGKPPAVSPQQAAQAEAVRQAKLAEAKAAQEKIIADKIAEKAAADALVAKTSASTTKSATAPAPAQPTSTSIIGAIGNFFSSAGDKIVELKDTLVEGTVAAADFVAEKASDAGTYIADKASELKESVTEAIENSALYKKVEAFLDKKEAQEKNFKLYMSKIGIYPKVTVTKDTEVKSPETELTSITMAPVYNDQLVFQALKAGYNNIAAADNNTVSALLPVKFSFTIHGVSGIKRGDKFKVIGIPRQYEQNGFFQVTSVKHTIDAMLWKTEVEGGLRLNK